MTMNARRLAAWRVLPLVLTWALGLAIASPAAALECVILLHGLARTSSSMAEMAAAFEQQGYAVANEGYPSREFPIEELAVMAVEAGVEACPSDSKVHFVTHSLGGILVRYYLSANELPSLGRVVMLAPPNQGSEIVDDYRSLPGFEFLNGPAGQQLGTDSESIPSTLGPVTYEAGIIAGTRTFNPILSQSLPNPDDGKVSVERTKVEGMADFIVLPYSHPFIMKADEVIEQTLYFIKRGEFSKAASELPSASD